MKKKIYEFIGTRLRPVELRLILKHAWGIRRRNLVLPDGRIYFIDPVSDLGLKLLNQEYEPQMTTAIRDLLQEGDCFIDLGANEGFFSVLAGKLCGVKGKVISIEPQKRLWPVIVYNLSLNDLCNVQLVPYGIGSEKSVLNLQLYPGTNSGASSFSESFNFQISFARFRKKLYGSQLVKVIRLDDLKEIFPKKIKLIKIDIEGFELEALKGAVHLLTEHVFENILIEVHREALLGMNQSEKQIDELLARFSYEKVSLSDNLNLYSCA